jgi:exodeoxyribonuclease V beta subunit
MKPLVPTGIPLRGVQLIEASAGTGKTFTITTLYLRLLLERELAVPQILVVTFTRAATAELKDRVRGRISLALAALNGTPPKDDATLSAYLESRAAHRARDRHLLALALSEFDRAAISTIHGFCSRILGDRAFESRIDFSAELIEGDDIELQQLVRDWWTNILHRAPAAAVRHLQKKFTLKNLMEVAHRSTGDSDVPVEPETSLPDLSDVHMTMSQAHDTWAGLMRREGTAAHDLLVSMTGSLHQRVLSAGHVAGLFDALGHHLDRPSMEMMRNLERITVPYLTKKTVSKGTTPEHPLFSAATVLYTL